MIDKIITLLASSELLSYPIRVFGNLLNSALSSALSNRQAVIVYYTDPYRIRIFNLICEIKKESEMLLGYNEAHQLFTAVAKTQKIKGDIAEVGVYQGGSARLICEAKGDKSLHLFDTFEGLPEAGEVDGLFHKAQFKASLGYVQHHLKKYKNVYLYKGMFPSTTKPVKNKKFSLVHLDADLYESTINALKFFYPRINRGGIIIAHDYTPAEGVRKATVAIGIWKAFDEFFKDKPEPIIELSGTQCLVVKL